MEEVPLPGTPLRFDFYLPHYEVAVEVHGEQHYSYSSFFHGTQWDFIQAKRNDRMKKEWCELNGITLIELPYNESEKEWEKRLTSLTNE
jgi:hypothetical protein